MSLLSPKITFQQRFSHPTEKLGDRKLACSNKTWTRRTGFIDFRRRGWQVSGWRKRHAFYITISWENKQTEGSDQKHSSGSVTFLNTITWLRNISLWKSILEELFPRMYQIYPCWIFSFYNDLRLKPQNFRRS